MTVAEKDVRGMRVAILVENGFEEVELKEPKKALDAAGAKTSIVSPQKRRVKSWRYREWGDEFPVDVTLDKARATSFDALLLPGGVMNPDALRLQPKAVDFVRSFFASHKPVAVICHGLWTVLEAGEVRGRHMTSWPSLKTDLRNAGAEWIDAEVVVDGNMVSSRKPDDIPAFNRKMLQVFGQMRTQLARHGQPAPLESCRGKVETIVPHTVSDRRLDKQMEMRQFGGTGRQVSVVGEGTWYIETGDRRTAVGAIRKGLDLGMNLIDTAEIYGQGESEEIVGEAITGRRDSVFLVSKVRPEHATRSGTIEACEGSLARLKTKSLDCYLLHWRGNHPLEETISAFLELKHSGKILSWGVSNFDVGDLEEAWDLSDDDGRMAANQVLYHLKDRAIEHTVIPWCERHGVTIMAYSPFGHGNFPGPETQGGKVLGAIAGAHGATPRQVALGVPHP